MLYASWRYAIRAHLVRDEVTYDIQWAIEHRIVGGQALYALGFALCVRSTYWSIVFIVLIQLHFAIAPKIPGLKRV